jgi:DNA-binding PucR family transcriptional regulator
MTHATHEHDVIQLATTAVRSFGGAVAEGIFVDGSWQAVSATDGRLSPVAATLARLGSSSGQVSIDGRPWAWAYPLAGVGGSIGHLVVSAERAPAQHDQFALGLLAQQSGAAIVNARLHDREQTATRALQTANEQLAASAVTTHRQLEIHERLTRIAGERDRLHAIAVAVRELTGYAVVIEDRHGNVEAWSGPGGPPPSPKPDPAARTSRLRAVTKAEGPLRTEGRLVAVATMGDEILGAIALLDPDETCGPIDAMALEHANTVLETELAHRRVVIETELRLRRDLVEELLAGTSEAPERARVMGYDVARPHRVVIVQCVQTRHTQEQFFHAVRDAVVDLGVSSLLVSRVGVVVMISPADGGWSALQRAAGAALGPGASCRVGVGGVAKSPADLPQSHRQAQFALSLQRQSGGPAQVTMFDDLGIYGLIADIPDPSAVSDMIGRWVGPIIDYDEEHGTSLVETLACYLEHGGNYDATAKSLIIHRSTLRYRLQRLREISGHDLANPDTRFNLQLATRALAALEGMRRTDPDDTSGTTV